MDLWHRMKHLFEGNTWLLADPGLGACGSIPRLLKWVLEGLEGQRKKRVWRVDKEREREHTVALQGSLGFLRSIARKMNGRRRFVCYVGVVNVRVANKKMRKKAQASFERCIVVTECH